MNVNHVASTYMGVRKGDSGGQAPPWILNILAKKVVFLVSSGKKQILLLLDPLDKFWKNPLVASLGKSV